MRVTSTTVTDAVRPALDSLGISRCGKGAPSDLVEPRVVTTCDASSSTWNATASTPCVTPAHTGRNRRWRAASTVHRSSRRLRPSGVCRFHVEHPPPIRCSASSLVPRSHDGRFGPLYIVRVPPPRDAARGVTWTAIRPKIRITWSVSLRPPLFRTGTRLESRRQQPPSTRSRGTLTRSRIRSPPLHPSVASRSNAGRRPDVRPEPGSSPGTMRRIRAGRALGSWTGVHPPRHHRTASVSPCESQGSPPPDAAVCLDESGSRWNVPDRVGRRTSPMSGRPAVSAERHPCHTSSAWWTGPAGRRAGWRRAGGGARQRTAVDTGSETTPGTSRVRPGHGATRHRYAMVASVIGPTPDHAGSSNRHRWTAPAGPRSWPPSTIPRPVTSSGSIRGVPSGGSLTISQPPGRSN